MKAVDVTLVVITFNRLPEVMRTLHRLCSMDESAAVIVVDNASTDGTTAEIRRKFPQVLVIRLAQNIGAAARNVGVSAARTAFVALCDDDTWWAPGSLLTGQHLLQQNPDIALACARVVVQPSGRVDPCSEQMSRSPLVADGLPGTPVLGFLAGASVIRRPAFLDAGGFDPRFFIGAEEGLLALDLAARGWHMVYQPSMLVYHAPSAVRDRPHRSKLVLRNTLYTAVMRLPLAMAISEVLRALSEAARARTLGWVVKQTASAMPWLLQGRRVIPTDVQRSLRAIRSQDRRPERRTTFGAALVARWRRAVTSIGFIHGRKRPWKS